MLDRDYLVCALASHPDVVPGSAFDRSCCACGRQVMIAPSGQRWLEKEPGTAVICVLCAAAQVTAEDPVTLATTHEQAARETAAKRPNSWRQRN